MTSVLIFTIWDILYLAALGMFAAVVLVSWIAIKFNRWMNRQ